MTDNEITEAYFRARGWEFVKGLPALMEADYWYNPDDCVFPEEITYVKLPNILESNSAFIEHVLEVMGGEGYRLDQVRGNVCRWLDESEHSRPRACYSEFIIDNNIFRAAVIAATRYWESKK